MKKQNLIYKIKSLSRLLFEQDEDEDIFGDDTDTADDTDDAEAAEDTEDTDTADDTDDAEIADDTEEEKLDVDLDDEVKLSKSIDHDLEALLIDFETDARKSSQLDDESNVIEIEESLNLNMLIEQDEQDYEEDIDLERFASEVARLVKNYTNLLDMEKMLVAKAREFIATRYGETAEDDMVNILDDQHDIVIDKTAPADTPDEHTPIAAGAGTGAAAGSE